MQRSAILEALEEQESYGNVRLNYFTFNTTFLAAPTGLVPPQIIQISNNISFLLEYINGNVANPAGTIVASPDIVVDLTDSNTGWKFSDNPVHWMQCVGNAQNPFILPQPKIIPGNAAISVTLTNNTGGVLVRVDLALIGAQIFTYNGFQLNDLPIVTNQQPY